MLKDFTVSETLLTTLHVSEHVLRKIHHYTFRPKHFPILGVGVATPQILGRGVVGGGKEGRRGLWTGRKILLYLNMYRKFVRKR